MKNGFQLLEKKEQNAVNTNRIECMEHLFCRVVWWRQRVKAQECVKALSFCSSSSNSSNASVKALILSIIPAVDLGVGLLCSVWLVGELALCLVLNKASWMVDRGYLSGRLSTVCLRAWVCIWSFNSITVNYVKMQWKYPLVSVVIVADQLCGYSRPKDWPEL